MGPLDDTNVLAGTVQRIIDHIGTDGSIDPQVLSELQGCDRESLSAIAYVLRRATESDSGDGLQLSDLADSPRFKEAEKLASGWDNEYHPNRKAALDMEFHFQRDRIPVARAQQMMADFAMGGIFNFPSAYVLAFHSVAHEMKDEDLDIVFKHSVKAVLRPSGTAREALSSIDNAKAHDAAWALLAGAAGELARRTPRANQAFKRLLTNDERTRLTDAVVQDSLRCVGTICGRARWSNPERREPSDPSVLDAERTTRERFTRVLEDLTFIYRHVFEENLWSLLEDAHHGVLTTAPSRAWALHY